MTQAKPNGGSTLQESKEKDIGDLKKEAGVQSRPSTLETMMSSENFILEDFLKENPEILLSEINKILYWLGVSDWFVALTNISAPDGNNLIRITFCPPKPNKILIKEIEDTSKTIVIESENA